MTMILMIFNKLLKGVGYFKKGFLFPLFIILSGCSTLSINERTYTSDGKQIVVRSDDIEVQISKDQNYWVVFYVNNTNEPKCVGTTWDLFDLIPRIPNKLIYVDSYRTIAIGYFEERIWNFDHLRVMIGGSGYVNRFVVIQPYNNRKDCMFPKGKTL